MVILRVSYMKHELFLGIRAATNKLLFTALLTN